MVVVLNPLFLSCCKIGKREAGKFERAHGINALALVNRVPCQNLTIFEKALGQKMKYPPTFVPKIKHLVPILEDPRNLSLEDKV